MLRPLVLAGLAVVSLHAFGQAPAKAAAPAPGEAQVREALNGILQPNSIVALRKAGYGDFWEVQLTNGDLLYADKTASFVFSGSLIDLKTKSNITQARVNELSRINFSDLPLGQAIKQVRGNGKRVLATFEDPNCGYCKKLAQDMADLKDATIYTFMVPILSPDSGEKSRNIWCAKDRAKAWNDWMTENKAPAKAECDTPLERNEELRRKLRITGTPTMYLADGNRLGGYVPVAELDRMMNEAHEKQKAQAKK